MAVEGLFCNTIRVGINLSGFDELFKPYIDLASAVYLSYAGRSGFTFLHALLRGTSWSSPARYKLCDSTGVRFLIVSKLKHALLNISLVNCYTWSLARTFGNLYLLTRYVMRAF